MHNFPDAVKLWCQILKGCDCVEDVIDATAGGLARGAVGVLLESVCVRIDADVEAIAIKAGALIWEAAITRAYVDYDVTAGP